MCGSLVPANRFALCHLCPMSGGDCQLCGLLMQPSLLWPALGQLAAGACSPTSTPIWSPIWASCCWRAIALTSSSVASFISMSSWPAGPVCVKHQEAQSNRACCLQIRTTSLTFYGAFLPEVQSMLKQQMTVACRKMRKSEAIHRKIASLRHKIIRSVRNYPYSSVFSRFAHRSVWFDHRTARKALLNLPLFVISS